MADIFQKRGSLKVHLGKRRKPVPEYKIEEVVTVIIDRAQSNIASDSSGSGYALLNTVENLTKYLQDQVSTTVTSDRP